VTSITVRQRCVLHGPGINTPRMRQTTGITMRKFRLLHLASAVLGLLLTTAMTTQEAGARGFSHGGGGFHAAPHFSAPRRVSAPRRSYAPHFRTARRFNNSHVSSGGGHSHPSNRLVNPAGRSPLASHAALSHAGHLRPPHQIGAYRPARWVGGALIAGAGAYYYNDFGLAMLPGPDGIPFDLEYYVRSLPDDGMLPAGDPIYGMVDPSQDGRQWTATSMAPDFQYKAAAKYESREDARDAALKGCRARSLVPDKCATVASQQWVAGVSCEANTDGGEPSKRSVVSPGANAKAAISNAYSAALKDDLFRKDDCKVRVLSAANGDESKFSDNK
jgi:hypothetical protein